MRRVEALTTTELTRMERLVEELLALARLDEGAGIERGEVAIGALLAELARTGPARPELGEVTRGRVRADAQLPGARRPQPSVMARSMPFSSASWRDRLRIALARSALTLR